MNKKRAYSVTIVNNETGHSKTTDCDGYFAHLSVYTDSVLTVNQEKINESVMALAGAVVPIDIASSVAALYSYFGHESMEVILGHLFLSLKEQEVRSKNPSGIVLPS